MVLSYMLTSCSSELDEATFKQPAVLEVKMDLDAQPAINGALQFTGGTVWLDEFSFDGDRLQAEDLYFEREYEPALSVDFNAGQSIPQLNFDIPQGTYSRIRINFELDSEQEHSLVAYGTYTTLTGSSIPVKLEIENIQLYTLIAQNDAGAAEINLNANFASIGTIQFTPSHWFIDVPQSMLEVAAQVPVDGQLTILINEDFNEDILDIVEDRLDEKVEFIIE